MNAENKTAIIMVGGGMKSPHGGGFLYALATELGIADALALQNELRALFT